MIIALANGSDTESDPYRIATGEQFILGVRRHSGKSPSSGDPVYRIGQVGDESAASQFSKYTVNL
jgi:hypothetical protein